MCASTLFVFDELRGTDHIYAHVRKKETRAHVHHRAHCKRYMTRGTRASYDTVSWLFAIDTSL